MSRTSSRQRRLKQLERAVTTRRDTQVIRDLFGEYDKDEDELDDVVLTSYYAACSARYAMRAPRYRHRAPRWMQLLHDRNYLSDLEFLEHFRLDRDAFFCLVALLNDAPTFRSTGTKPLRGDAALHIMVLLKTLGASGNDTTSSKVALFVGIGTGSVGNYLRRAAAVQALARSIIAWPDVAEREQIAARVQHLYGFPNCVGMADGTLFPLEYKPTHNGEDYLCRKGVYAVNALIVCDDRARVRSLVAGWPGSAHDNRVWSNSHIARSPGEYFQHNKYLLPFQSDWVLRSNGREMGRSPMMSTSS